MASKAKETGRKISEARQKKGWTKAELAREAGVSDVAITKLERGEIGKRSRILGDVLRALGLEEKPLVDLSPDEEEVVKKFRDLDASGQRLSLEMVRRLAEGVQLAREAVELHEERRVLLENAPQPPQERRKKPTLRVVHDTPSGATGGPCDCDTIPIRLIGDVAAGWPVESWRSGDMHPVPAHLIPTNRPLQDFGVIAAMGDSMEPTIKNGQHVLVERTELGRYRKGDIVIAMIGTDGDSEVTLKRYKAQRKGVITLEADNPEHEDQKHEPGKCVVQSRVLEVLDD